MTTDYSLEMRDVSLKYFTESSRGSVKDLVINRIKGVKRNRNAPFELASMTLRVSCGETIGIVGRNGSGKSTLLKLIAGVFNPNSGEIFRRGKIFPLIDISTGMHPDLTCRQNIYLSSAYFGKSRKETDEFIRDVVAWTQIEDVLDEPFHSLSTGMQSRLAFAVATCLSPDLLLVDEIMSVGDLQFREKSQKLMNELALKGTALLIVSHDLDFLETTVQRLIWIEKGRLLMDGPIELIMPHYRDSFQSH